ncbi:hypothetical protein KL86PLE_30415 [uncultured Pleomorphomonas sp.]|uniref:Uncharacterized protein n=1 Tax=uncultured Pleomorphomonas sp. TaxID=442121 RepID=A0A212LEQ9_9HYPH|nr:hypothetical protein KL86PLE_30415 [uncultured Pleomorphomonas sp.]
MIACFLRAIKRKSAKNRDCGARRQRSGSAENNAGAHAKRPRSGGRLPVKCLRKAEPKSHKPSEKTLDNFDIVHAKILKIVGHGNHKLKKAGREERERAFSRANYQKTGCP